MTNLRDLEADRRLVGRFREIRGSEWTTSEKDILTNVADAALDEIERLKRMLVFKSDDGYDSLLKGQRVGPFPTEADAWAAVRKSAATVADKAAMK